MSRVLTAAGSRAALPGSIFIENTAIHLPIVLEGRRNKKTRCDSRSIIHLGKYLGIAYGAERTGVVRFKRAIRQMDPCYAPWRSAVTLDNN